ncbi:integrator complex subunit 6-a-like protein [Dermatophagoides farinae]|uniref:Integrator complex subunit 6-a-like protein n=1 Tax=Dermatophagoides farinae TaxID=6954 RepID=A0A9D4NT78_DERFA|nr:integrator complex subunit 6-a-like protein [Dermatophagoides farinae]
MNQRAHSGAKQTLLDITKETVDRFIKNRQKDIAARGDRYMLLTFDETPYNIKAGWKETHAVFVNELKNLSATGLTTMNTALKNSFDYLNVNRMQSGIDTYGMGRCPYFLESAVIILITDGGRFSTVNNVQDELIIPASNCPGSEFTIEPFRWDQRLFSIVLRFNGIYRNDQTQTVTSVGCDPSSINQLSEETGGRSFSVTSKNEIYWSIDYILARLHHGVMVKFEKFGPDPPMIPPPINGCGGNDESRANNFDRSWQCTRNMILVRPTTKGYSMGHWPIPESYWPDPNIPSLQPRTAQPIIRYTCTNSEPTVIENLPFDKYELDPSPLTNFILARKQPNVAWQVFMANSQRNSEFGQPFGYLKASTNLACVNLFVLPYNYPMLLPLLEELFKQLQGKPTREWRQQFDNYLKGMPVYYATSLRRALQRMGAPNLIPDNMELYATVNLNNIIKKQKHNAKIEFDKLTSSMGQHKPINIEWPRISTNHFSLMYHNRKTIGDLFCSNPSLKRTFAQRPYDFQDFNGFIVRYKDRPHSEYKTSFYRNPADIPRSELLRQAVKIRQIFFQKHMSLAKFTMDEDQTFNLPVSQMGNYQEYLKKKQPPLRELEAAPSRQHMFGNPFKLDKKNPMIIDEADIELSNNGGGNGGSNSGGDGQSKGMKRSLSSSALAAGVQGGPPKQRRKPGPLPKDYSYSRSRSPSPLMFNQPPPTPPPQYMMSPQQQQSSSPNSFYGVGNYHPNSNNQMYQTVNGSTSSSQQQLASNLVNQKLLQPSQIVKSNIKTNNNGNFKNNTGDPTIRGAFGYQLSSQQSSISNYPGHGQQQPQLFKPITSRPTGFGGSLQQQQQQQLSIFQNHNQQQQTKQIQVISNGNGQQQPFSTGSNPFPKLNQHLVNGSSGGGGKQLGYFATGNNFNPHRGYMFSKEENEKLKSVLHFVRMKDSKSLIQIVSTQKGVFADRLLFEAVSYAQRFKMTSITQILSNHFGIRVQYALDIIANNNPRMMTTTIANNTTTAVAVTTSTTAK